MRIHFIDTTVFETQMEKLRQYETAIVPREYLFTRHVKSGGFLLQGLF